MGHEYLPSGRGEGTAASAGVDEVVEKSCYETESLSFRLNLKAEELNKCRRISGLALDFRKHNDPDGHLAGLLSGIETTVEPAKLAEPSKQLKSQRNGGRL